MSPDMVRRPAIAGFTLVELMIVVAIIGILAAIAIPNLVSAQLSAKRSEVPVTVDAIRTAEEAYDSANDLFMSAPPEPVDDGLLGKVMHTWPTGDAAWNTLGYFPDGSLRGNYQVFGSETDFMIIGHSDVDDDDTIAIYTATSNNRLQVSQSNVF